MKSKMRALVILLAVICTIAVTGWQVHDAFFDNDTQPVMLDMQSNISSIGDMIAEDIMRKNAAMVDDTEDIEATDNAVEIKIKDDLATVSKNSDPSRYKLNYETTLNGQIKVYDGYRSKFKVPVTIDGNNKAIYDCILEYKSGQMNLSLIATEDFESNSSDKLRIQVDNGVSCKIKDFDSFGLGDGFSNDVYSIVVKPNIKTTGLNVELGAKMKGSSVKKGDIVISCVLWPTKCDIGNKMSFTLGDNSLNATFVESRSFDSVDSNNDGKINATDATSILVTSAAIGAGDMESVDKIDADITKMDVNLDGEVNATDAAIVLNMSASMGTGKEYASVDEYFSSIKNN